MEDKASKTWFEIFLVPFVIACVGILSTQRITHAQLESAERIAKANTDNENARAKSEEQIKVLEIFSDQFKSEDLSKRKTAVRMLIVLEPELGAKLAEAVAETDSAPEVRAIADTVVKQFTERGNSFVVIGSYPTLQAAQGTAQNLALKTPTTPYPFEVYRSDNGYYALTLGGHLSSTEANNRMVAAKKFASDAYVRVSDRWGDNILK
jgi:hypothetical protein